MDSARNIMTLAAVGCSATVLNIDPSLAAVISSIALAAVGLLAVTFKGSRDLIDRLTTQNADQQKQIDALKAKEADCDKIRWAMADMAEEIRKLKVAKS